MNSTSDSATSRLLRSAIARASEALERAGVASPRSDAEILAAHTLGRTRGELGIAIALGESLDAARAEHFGRLVERRANREPLQHITGRAPFRHIELAVGPGVFIPRPETETLVDVGLQLVSLATGEAQDTTLVGLDLCAGSGAVGLALASERPDIEMLAVEAADETVPWLQRNIDAIARGRVRAQHGDIRNLTTDDLPGGRPVDFIVSNPPYVPSGEHPEDIETDEYDPARALYSGEDGLDLIREIAALSRRLCRVGVAVEHTESQGSAVRDFFAQAGWPAQGTVRDLTGRDRVTWGAIQLLG